MLSLLKRKVIKCQGLPAPDRYFLLSSIKRTERTLEKQFTVNAHPTWVCLHLKSSGILPKIISCATTGLCKTPKDMIGKTPCNSKTRWCYRSFHTCPCSADCGKSIQEMPSGWQHWDQRCPCKTFLNIALVVYSLSLLQPPFLLTCCLSTSASRSPRKTTDRHITLCGNQNWGLQNTHICWEKAQLPHPHSSCDLNSPYEPRKQKESKRSLCPGSNSRF